MSETGEGSPQPALTDRQRTNVRQHVAEVVLTEGAHTNERVRRAREKNRVMNMDAALAELVESPSEIVTRARERLGEFGVTRNAQGDKDRNLQERARYNNGTTALDQVANFIEQGYEGLDPTERTQLVNNVRDIFLNHNILGRDFQNLPTAQQNAQIAAMLQDSQYAKLVVEQIEKVNELTFTSESDIHTARTARAEAEGKQAVARSAVTRQGRMAGETLRRLEDIRTETIPANPQIAAADAAIIAATEARENAQKALTHAQETLDTAQRRYDEAADESTTGRVPQHLAVRLREAQRLYTAAMNNLQSRENSLSNMQDQRIQLIGSTSDTSNREDELETRLEQRYNQLDEARIANRRAPEETTARRVEERELVEKRAREEEQFNRQVENAFAVATRKYLNERVRQAVNTLEELEPGYLTEEVATVRKAMGEAIRTRWIRNETRTRGIFRRRVTEQVVSREVVERDFRRLIAEGPNGMLRELLGGIDVRYPGTDENAPTQRLTPDQIRELMGNDLFSDEMKKHFVKNVLANRILTSQIRPAEVHQIMEADWGKGMIKAALEKNSEFRNTITQLTDSQDLDLDKPEFRHRLARSLVDHPGLWLTLGIGNVIHALWKSITTDPNQHLREQVAA